jgi:hypothetical protein
MGLTEIHQFLEPFREPDATLWDVRVLGQERNDGTWIGWLEFHSPVQGTRRTDRETTQSNIDALRYWAMGLEPIYVEGAFDRAR